MATVAGNSPRIASSAHAFSSHASGEILPSTWRVITLPKVPPNKFALVADVSTGTTVLRIESNSSAGALGLPISSRDAAPSATLQWRWKVDRVLARADMRSKRGDDFAARVYVFFDVPLDSLPFFERVKIKLVRMLSGADVPTAALCYVWDNQQPIGHTQWSPYTNRVRMLVLQSGAPRINQWATETRDVAADF